MNVSHELKTRQVVATYQINRSNGFCRDLDGAIEFQRRFDDAGGAAILTALLTV